MGLAWIQNVPKSGERHVERLPCGAEILAITLLNSANFDIPFDFPLSAFLSSVPFPLKLCGKKNSKLGRFSQGYCRGKIPQLF
jgi:hypothetical protein